MWKFWITGVMALILAGCSSEPSADLNPDGPTATMDEFRIVEGEGWTGNLTYLDYGSNERVTIPTAASVNIASQTSLNYSISYPDEPWEDTKAKIKLSKSGRMLDGHPIVFHAVQDDGRLEIRTLHQGEDAEKPAQIQMTYRLGASVFVISKDVRADETAAFVNRNVYYFSRP